MAVFTPIDNERKGWYQWWRWPLAIILSPIIGILSMVFVYFFVNPNWFTVIVGGAVQGTVATTVFYFGVPYAKWRSTLIWVILYWLLFISAIALQMGMGMFQINLSVMQSVMIVVGTILALVGLRFNEWGESKSGKSNEVKVKQSDDWLD